MRKVLGFSKISTSNKMTIIKPVAEKLEVKKGDIILFSEERNKIIIEKACLTKS